MSQKEVKYFKVGPLPPLGVMSEGQRVSADGQGDENATKEPVRKYGSGTAQAPMATNV